MINKYRMKIAVIIISVLAAATAVYGFDVDRLRKFNGDFLDCNHEMGGSLTEFRVDILQCATKRDGEVLNANGEYIKDVTLRRLGDLISETGRLEQARGIYSKCYDDVVATGVIGDDQTAKIITCIAPLIPLIDKLQ